ncbi:hypothetical protein C5C99_01375 [Rathayibacter sp. AY1C4]|uniref:hypothetical protein n=1 Tax=Rathayibacter sp. AY1C4 TaxID=2080537 RepID=UPI000CE7FBFB|nr:hypothetical protein [Rathayibacter sp. AY1C4]PPH23316.1 hypothetical protein C5C99_01375 [Rathayibacter sp. AY1C4]
MDGLKTRLRQIGVFLRDEPFKVDGGLVLLGVLHWAATQLWLPNVWLGLASADPQSDVQALYIGVLAAAAVVAGFAGVVVIFGLSAQTPRFQTFRATAGATLGKAWMSTTLSGFEAVALCIAATVVSLAGAAWLGPWLFEISLLVLLHGTARLVWLLRQLIKIVVADDVLAHKASQRRPVAELPFMRRTSGGS